MLSLFIYYLTISSAMAQVPVVTPSEGALQASPFISERPEPAESEPSVSPPVTAAPPSETAETEGLAVTQMRYGSARFGVTTGPRLAGPGLELNLGLLEIDGVAAEGAHAAFLKVASLGGGVAFDGAGNTVGNGSYTPHLEGGIMYRWVDARFLSDCSPVLGGSASMSTGYERETTANHVSISATGGLACTDGSYVVLVNASVGALLTLPDQIFGSNGTSPVRTERDIEGGPVIGLRISLAGESGWIAAAKIAHALLVSGESITTGELEFNAPLITFGEEGRKRALYAGVSGRLMRRNDLPDSRETGGIGASLNIGIGPDSGSAR